MADERKNTPVKRLRAGMITGSIFKNTRKNADGNDFDSYNVKLTKNYRTESGEYRVTDNYGSRDVANLILVAQKAQEFMTLQID